MNKDELILKELMYNVELIKFSQAFQSILSIHELNRTNLELIKNNSHLFLNNLEINDNYKICYARLIAMKNNNFIMDAKINELITIMDQVHEQK